MEGFVCWGTGSIIISMLDKTSWAHIGSGGGCEMVIARMCQVSRRARTRNSRLALGVLCRTAWSLGARQLVVFEEVQRDVEPVNDEYKRLCII